MDTAAPDTSITSGPAGPTNDNTPTFAFTSSEAGATFECRTDGGSWSACTSPATLAALADGAHSFDVRAKDAAGNTDATPAGRSFTVNTQDTTAPDTAITGGPTGTTGDNTPTFTFTATETGATFECRIDAGSWNACSSPLTTAALAGGPHTFAVRAKDALGNVDASPASRSFTVSIADTTAPDTAITSGPSGPTNDNTPTFGFNAPGESGATFECRIDTGSWNACSSPLTTAALADGAHTFAVRAKDAAGNVDQSPAARSFTVSTAPPPPPVPTCKGQAATKVGTAGDDRIVGTSGRDVIVALGGRDKVAGKGGDDVICAAGGDDRVHGNSGRDTVAGGGGADRVWGDGGDDRLSGGSGNDRVWGGSGADQAGGGGGGDRVFGNGGNDRLLGGAGADRLLGGPGNDWLDGGPQRDRCRGGSGVNQTQGCEI